MIVIALLVLLFTCWCLWGWFVGESRNIRWIRHWCGGMFVVMVTLIASAGGFLVGRGLERSTARDNAFEALQVIGDRLEAGDRQHVITAIRALDHRGDPDADAYDVLDELPQLVEKLQDTSNSASADADKLPEQIGNAGLIRGSLN